MILEHLSNDRNDTPPEEEYKSRRAEADLARNYEIVKAISVA
jgi:hypothetical protein